MALPRRVLITGACGNLGAKLSGHLAGRCELVRLDRDGDGKEVVRADLATWDERWIGHFLDVNCVVHLAGNPTAADPWEKLIGPNLDAVLNVFEAAACAGVRRVIYASSNHVLGGYRDELGVVLTPDLAPRPGLRYRSGGVERDSLAYGTSKLFGERIGRHFAEARGLEVLAVRIGWVWRGDNTPGGLPTDREEWFRQMWLSDRDFLHLMECCLEARLEQRFAVVHGMSVNRGMRWCLEATRQLLGYQPVDGIDQA
ncbi:MAG: NAD(P)-dependent oxidoreductase [Gemmataceae bacterium]